MTIDTLTKLTFSQFVITSIQSILFCFVGAISVEQLDAFLTLFSLIYEFHFESHFRSSIQSNLLK